MFEKFNLYDIQKDFITKAQSVIENDKIGIFSSPTGTGKTLSLLCTLSQYIQPDPDPDSETENLSATEGIKEKKSSSTDNVLNKHNKTNNSKNSSSSGISAENQLLANMLFGQPSHHPTIFYCSRTHSQLNQAIRELKRVVPGCRSVIIGSRRIYCLNADVKKDSDLEGINERCNALVKEGGCEYYDNFEGGLAMGMDLESEFVKGFSERQGGKNVKENRVVNLDSGNINIKDFTRCNCNENLEMNSIKACSEHKINTQKYTNDKINCIADDKYIKNTNKNSQNSISTSQKTDTLSNTILDIEDINTHCATNKTCPYFTVKHYSQSCDILFLPYTLLFSKEGRKSANIEIKNSIVVVDEAHNIYETVIQMNTMTIHFGVIHKYWNAFLAYKMRYEKRMLKVNLEKIKNVILILERLKEFMVKYGVNSSDIKEIDSNKESGYNKNKKFKHNNMSINLNINNTPNKTNNTNDIKTTSIDNIKNKENIDNFNKESNVIKDNLNLLKNNNLHASDSLVQQNSTTVQSQESLQENVMRVSEFLIKSNLLDFNMLEIEDYIRENNITQKLEGFSTNLHSQLFNIAKFLRLLVNSDNNGRIFYTDKRVRFTPLDPKMYFEDIMECKSLILAGGTMEPVDNLKSIFENREIEYHSYPSICKNFVSFILQEGPSKREIRLNYESRDNMDNAKEIMASVFNLSNPVKKGGIICFIPSKNYIKIFRETLKLFKFKKKIMFDDECNFSDYENEIKASESVILFSVLGGRMSEGINFSDDLCRLLIVIGVPYPTLNSELKERIKYNGSNYSTLVAMKVVNQALGRALRHQKDHSGIVLIDSRYKNLMNYIVPWIREKIRISNFPTTLVEIAGFLNKR